MGSIVGFAMLPWCLLGLRYRARLWSVSSEKGRGLRGVQHQWVLDFGAPLCSITKVDCFLTVAM